MPRDGALARSSAELTSHPENRGLTELAATPLVRATASLCLPLHPGPTILPHAAFPADTPASRRPRPAYLYLYTYISALPTLPSASPLPSFPSTVAKGRFVHPPCALPPPPTAVVVPSLRLSGRPGARRPRRPSLSRGRFPCSPRIARLTPGRRASRKRLDRVRRRATSRVPTSPRRSRARRGGVHICACIYTRGDISRTKSRGAL